MKNQGGGREIYDTLVNPKLHASKPYHPRQHGSFLINRYEKGGLESYHGRDVYILYMYVYRYVHIGKYMFIYRFTCIHIIKRYVSTYTQE